MKPITTQYTKEDLIEFQHIFARTSGRRRTMVMRTLYCCLGIVGLICCRLMYTAKGRISVSMVVELLVSGTFLLGCIFYYRLTAWSARRMMPKEIKRQVFLFEKDGLVISDAIQTSKLPYEKITLWVESKNQVALFFSQKHGLLLPKRDVEDPDALRNYLQEKLSCQRTEFSF